MKLRYIFAALLCLCVLIAPAAAAGGSGTAANPYIIETAAELQSMANDLSAHYRLANDIDLSGVTWTPIGSGSAGFYGSFDGNGKTIKNLDLSSSNQYTGFFGVVTSGAVIKDVTFQDCSVTSTTTTSGWSGVVIGSIIMSSSAHETAVISNVNCVRCSMSGGGSHIGCLVGLVNTNADVEITDCDVSYSEVETPSRLVGCFVGGITGTSSVEITRCNVLYSHTRTIERGSGCFVGAVASSSSLVIDSSSAQNSISEVHNNMQAGCLVGLVASTSFVNVLNCDVVNCLAKGTTEVGGIVGSVGDSGSVVTAQTCTVTGCTIVATVDYAGGIAGRCGSGTTGTFTDCTVTDSIIIASGYAAGICPAYS